MSNPNIILANIQELLLECSRIDLPPHIQEAVNAVYAATERVMVDSYDPDYCEDPTVTSNHSPEHQDY